MKVFRLISICCALLFTYNLSHASDWYQIEVIAFEYAHPNSDEMELWDKHPGEPNWSAGINLTDESTARARKKQEDAQAAQATADEAHTHSDHQASPVQGQQEGQPTDNQFVPVEQILSGQPGNAAPNAATQKNAPLAFVSLPPSQYTMGDIQRKLQNQSSYRILTHAAWRQTPLSDSNPGGVHIFGGKLLDHEGATGARYEFEGLIAFKSTRYMHLDVDALLREPESSKMANKYDSPADLGLLESKNNGSERMPIYEVYRMLQSQRVRANKVYYFDHPLMGVIIKVSPYGG